MLMLQQILFFQKDFLRATILQKYRLGQKKLNTYNIWSTFQLITDWLFNNSFPFKMSFRSNVKN